MPTDNKTLVRRMYEEVWNMRRLEVARELISPSHAVQLTDATDPGIGPEAYARNVTEFVRAFPDFKFTVLDLIAENDKVVACWNISGTHQGEYRGVAPTGKNDFGGRNYHQSTGQRKDHGLLCELGSLGPDATARRSSRRPWATLEGFGTVDGT